MRSSDRAFPVGLRGVKAEVAVRLKNHQTECAGFGVNKQQR